MTRQGPQTTGAKTWSEVPQEDEVGATERSNRCETVVAFREVLTYEAPQFLHFMPSFSAASCSDRICLFVRLHSVVHFRECMSLRSRFDTGVGPRCAYVSGVFSYLPYQY